MGRVFLVELEGRSYRCRFCNNNVALADDVLSRVLSLFIFLCEFSQLLSSFPSTNFAHTCYNFVRSNSGIQFLNNLNRKREF